MKTTSEVQVPSSISRRRTELVGLTIFVLGALVVGTVVASLWPAPPDATVLGGSIGLLRASLIVLSAAFAAYVVEKERNLQKLEGAYANERLLSRASDQRLEEIAWLMQEPAGRSGSGSKDYLRDLADALCTRLDGDEALIFLVEGDELVLRETNGHASHLVGTGAPVREHPGIAGYVARTRHPLVVSDGLDVAELTGLELGEHVLSTMSVPMIAGDELVGVVSVSVTAGERRFNEYDLHRLELSGTQVALAIRLEELVGGEADLSERVEAIERMRAEGVAGLLRHDDVASAAGEARSSRAGGTRVLIADDDPAVLRMFHAAFTRRGYEVLLAPDGETAVTRATSERPRLVILDVVMPVLDGFGVLDRLRRLPDPPAVICVSGNGGVRDQLKALTMGADAYVTKPFELGDVVELAADVLNRPARLRAEHRRRALARLTGGVR